MIEQGRVESVSGTTAKIRPKASAACFGCMNLECKRGQGLIRVENPLGLPVENGQLVEAEVPLSSLAGETALALGPPILGFLAGYLLTGLFDSWGDPPRALCGMLTLFGTALCVYGIRRKFPPKNLPRIRKIIKQGS